MKLGLYERALKILRNFSDDVIESDPKFVNLKIQILWIIGLFDELEAFSRKVHQRYGALKFQRGEKNLEDLLRMRIILVGLYIQDIDRVYNEMEIV